MEKKVINYASTAKTARNVIEADGFQIKGDGLIGTAEDNREIKIISYASTTKSAKNILEADGFQIKGVGTIGAAKSINKHMYVAPIKIDENITEGQKAFAMIYNSMQKMLMDSGMMDKK